MCLHLARTPLARALRGLCAPFRATVGPRGPWGVISWALDGQYSCLASTMRRAHAGRDRGLYVAHRKGPASRALVWQSVPNLPAARLCGRACPTSQPRVCVAGLVFD